MKSTPFLLLIALTGSSLSVVNSTYAANSNTANNTTDTRTQTERELDEKLARLWADRPEYVALLQRQQKSDRPVRVVSTVPPENPKALKRAKIKGSVVVSFFVGEDGRVEAARVLDSPDKRVNEPSVAAILKWKFLPAMRGDKPVKTSVLLPMEWR